MLVRARPKDRKEWPNWATCCPDKEPYKAEMLVDLSDSEFSSESIQCACGNLFEIAERVRVVRVVKGPDRLVGRTVPFECLDLDEGPLEAA